MFCALALNHAEGVARYRLPKYPGATVREAGCLIAQGQAARIGKRACGFPERIRKHVLLEGEFDEDDSAWLCTTISAFLSLMELSSRGKTRTETQPHRLGSIGRGQA